MVECVLGALGEGCVLAKTDTMSCDPESPPSSRVSVAAAEDDGVAAAVAANSSSFAVAAAAWFAGGPVGTVVVWCAGGLIVDCVLGVLGVGGACWHHLTPQSDDPRAPPRLRIRPTLQCAAIDTFHSARHD